MALTLHFFLLSYVVRKRRYVIRIMKAKRQEKRGGEKGCMRELKEKRRLSSLNYHSLRCTL
jgi:hypothetical protein